MSTPTNGYAASFFKKGSVIKCSVDARNLKQLVDVISSIQEGDELVMFERTEDSKRRSLQERGTPIENQPTHNLTRVPAADVKKRKEEWQAKRGSGSHGL